MSSEKKLNLYQKIIEVRKSIDVLKKDASGYKYDYVSGNQILSKIKSKMDELGLLLVPDIQRIDYETIEAEKDGKVSVQFVVNGAMTYSWINADNPDEKYSVGWHLLGMQNDPSKALGSGLTYSERYFLLKFFGIPTDDEDPDANQKSTFRPKYKAKSSSPRKASESQVNYMNTLIKDKLGKDPSEYWSQCNTDPKEMGSIEASNLIEKMKNVK